MKKAVALFLALVLTLSLAACGSSEKDEIKKPAAIEADDGETTESIIETEAEEEEEETSKAQADAAEVTIEETVLVDESGVKITAKSLSLDETFGADLKLLIENNSGKDLTFQCQNASVNGYMVETLMSVDVVNGKKANDTLTFMDSDLVDYGINSIADMEFSFNIFTSSDWEDYLNTETIQLKTSIADTYEYTFDDSGEIAYDSDGIKIVIKGLAEDTSLFGPSVVVYIENNTDSAFTVQANDVSINGFMVQEIFSCDVMPGKKAVDTITFMEEDLEENDIAAIETVDLSFNVFDSESWDDIVNTETMSILF